MNHLKGYWAAVLDVRCTWSIRLKAGRLPIPVLMLSSTHESLVRGFADTWGLTAYRTGRFWYAQATGERLTAILGSLSTFLIYRRHQSEAWLTLMQHITDHRGHRHKPLPDDVVAERLRLAEIATESDPFKVR